MHFSDACEQTEIDLENHYEPGWYEILWGGRTVVAEMTKTGKWVIPGVEGWIHEDYPIVGKRVVGQRISY